MDMDMDKDSSRETHWQCCQDGEMFISELPVISLSLPLPPSLSLLISIVQENEYHRDLNL
jgi:hypothetical protein